MMRLSHLRIAALALALAASPVAAQQYATPAGGIVLGTVPMCLDSNGKAISCPTATGSSANIVAIGGVPLAFGQAAMAASIPVVIASNQSAVPVSLASVPLPPGFSYTNITTATTTTIKSGAGVMHTLTINSLGTVASTTTIYDNTAGSGTKIATIDSLNLRGTVMYDVAFSTGLTLVTTGTIAPDITVAWR